MKAFKPTKWESKVREAIAKNGHSQKPLTFLFDEIGEHPDNSVREIMFYILKRALVEAADRENLQQHELVDSLERQLKLPSSNPDLSHDQAKASHEQVKQKPPRLWAMIILAAIAGGLASMMVAENWPTARIQPITTQESVR